MPLSYSRRRWVSIPLFVLSLTGAFVSKLLLDKHLLKAAGPGWFAAVCGETPPSDQVEGGPADESGAADSESPPSQAGAGDCQAVLVSKWSTIPPRDDSPQDLLTDQPQAGFQIPVAYVGLVYFLSLAIWFLFIGRATPDKPEWFRLPLLFVLGGLLFSAFYVGLMFLRMDEWCPWCLVTHALNLLIFIGMLLLRPAKAPVPVEASLGAAGSGPVEAAASARGALVVSHPSGALVGVCVLLAASCGAMLWNGYGVLVVQAQMKGLSERLKQFEGDAAFLAARYSSKPEVNITIRDDDPQTSRDEEFCKLVVFSDFQCPACRSFAFVVDKRLKTLFQNRLRLIWKHYPICTDCNPHVEHNVHPYACRAARAAEAARLQGGNDAFWKAHDLLFAAQQALKTLDYAKLARDLGLDAERFLTDMDSKAVSRRIAEDLEQAKALGIRSTPAIFLMDRPVDPTLAKIGAFWSHMAHSFNFNYDEKHYPERIRKLEAAVKLPPTSQPVHDHADHE